MTLSSHRTGCRGEEIAQSYLKNRGFRLEARNWRSGKLGEIDLVVYHPAQSILVFVEVKTRRTGFLESPLEAISPGKVQRMLQLAEAYLATHPGHADCGVRFDLISIVFPGNNKPADVLHLENAFGTDG
ncbi:YraN family protein [Vampirovibrio chlorellavorus]|uniref:YraN family protein n=1 Tax=Vampirovibrio chlorellavorus TaxID=758823 RepID=UPI0026EDD16C|nr:YraN family protein [Vampirovibrio chlorellavorus]